MRSVSGLAIAIQMVLLSSPFAAEQEQQCILPEPYLQGGPEGYANHLMGQVQKSGSESAPAGSHWRLDRVELLCNPEEWGDPSARVQLQHGSIRIWNVREWQDDEGRVFRQSQDRVLNFNADRLVWLAVGESVDVQGLTQAHFSGKVPPHAPDETESHAAVVPKEQNPVHYFWDPSRPSIPGSGEERHSGEPYTIPAGGPEGLGERLEIWLQLKASPMAGYRDVRYSYRWVPR